MLENTMTKLFSYFCRKYFFVLDSDKNLVNITQSVLRSGLVISVAVNGWKFVLENCTEYLNALKLRLVRGIR